MRKKTGQLVDQETDQNHMDGTFVWGQRCLSIFQHVQAIKLGN